MVEQVTAIEALREALANYAALFDPTILLASDAQLVMAEAAAIEKTAATVVALAAARVAETELWRREGDRSPAHALARRTGQTVGRAQEQLDTAARLRHQPDLDAAARRGEVSRDEAAAISAAAEANPAKERELIDKAKASSLKELRDECQKVKANADPDPEATRRRIHRDRRVRTFIDAEGGWNLHARGTPESGAEFMAALQPLWDAIFTRARSSAVTEPTEAYGFDALLELARWAHANRTAPAPTAAPPSEHRAVPGPTARHPACEPGAPPAPAPTGSSGTSGVERHDVSAVVPPTVPAGTPVKISVGIDLDAIFRGHPVDGETCEIFGVGPISVEAVRELMAGNPFIAAVLTKGRQVVGVAHLGRSANAHQVTALQWSMPVCTVEGCPCQSRLENDHNDPFATVRETELSNLDRLCRHHHSLKTNRGWSLVDGLGKRAFVPPDDPRHPRHARHGPPVAAALV